MEDRKDWLKAEDLRVGNLLKTITGEVVRIEDVEIENKPSPVYNLKVQGQENFYACGVLVHNCSMLEALPVPGAASATSGPPATETTGQTLDTPRVIAARQEQLRRGVENGVVQIRTNEDGNVDARVDPQALPHLRPNLQRVPDLQTDSPLQPDPIPEIVLGAGVQAVANRVAPAMVEAACFPGETAICTQGEESVKPIQTI